MAEPSDKSSRGLVVTPYLPEDPVVGGQLVLVVVGDDVCVSHPLTQDRVSIGRSSSNDISIDDATISRNHAVLDRGPPLRITDLGSVNGTHVRGKLLEPGSSADLAAGEAVRLGAVSVLLQYRSEPVRMRRLWSHDHFEGRVEDECARALRFKKQFALLHLCLEQERDERLLLQVLASELRAIDVIGHYGPGELEILMVETPAEEAGGLAARISAALERGRVSATFGIACSPRDSNEPSELSKRAREAARGQHADGSDSVTLEQIAARDANMRKLDELVTRVAKSDISVLLLGETGVGKEVMAEAIHNRSERAAELFLRISCVALSPTLIESELFGHTRGAFTGADRAKPGLLETANGGTVFLDEIGELPLEIQVKLLRVLEERRVLRVGDVESRPIDVRFVAATNRDLEHEVASGRFREDLFYRLNGISISIPPLRERPAELDRLANEFIATFCKRASRTPPLTLSPRARALVRSYSWPGNIRELRNAMERAVLLCPGPCIEPEHLPQEKMLATYTTAVGASGEPSPPPLDPSDAAERDRIRDALERAGGNQTAAAQELGISRRTMVNRMNKYGLPRPRKRAAPSD